MKKNIIIKFLVYLVKFNFKDYLYFKRLEYKIIPLGQYCLPRIITTRAKLKPPKQYGELTLPFDLNMHRSIDKITFLLNTNFESYFDGLFYDENNQYVNNNLFATYNHDKNLSKKTFIKKYTKYIKNFYKYLNIDKHLFFIFASSEAINIEQIYVLEKALSNLRNHKPYSLIVINHNLQNNLHIKSENISVINQEFFEYHDDWTYELNNTEAGLEFYSKIVMQLEQIINEKLNPIENFPTTIVINKNTCKI